MKNIFIAAVAAMLLAWLIIHAALCGWLGLSLSHEVRPLEAIVLVVNLLIAFSLQSFFATRINDLRAEKNVLIAECTEIIRLLREVGDLTDTQFRRAPIYGDVGFAIVSEFRRIANAITELQSCISMSQLRSLNGSLNTIWSDFFALKAAATGGGFPSSSYTVHQRGSQQRLLRALTTKIQRLIFALNSAQR